jgi:hypothetical protein
LDVSGSASQDTQAFIFGASQKLHICGTVKKGCAISAPSQARSPCRVCEGQRNLLTGRNAPKWRFYWEGEVVAALKTQCSHSRSASPKSCHHTQHPVLYDNGKPIVFRLLPRLSPPAGSQFPFFSTFQKTARKSAAVKGATTRSKERKSEESEQNY